MTTTLTETATFDTPITVPSGADIIKASGVNNPFQSITNRTKFLKDRDDARYVAATRYIDLVPFGVNLAEWNFAGGGTWLSIANSVALLIPIRSNDLQNGSTLSSIAMQVTPGAARSGTNRTNIKLYRTTYSAGASPTLTQLGSTTYDDGTSNRQFITISGLSEVVDRTQYAYYCVLIAGNNASTNNDIFWAVNITRTPSATAVL